MTPNLENQSIYDPIHQLELLDLQCQSLRKDLYKINSIYLHVIRKILPGVIKETILQLILSNNTNLDNKEVEKSKASFQERVEKIISESIAVLTIENLIAFADTIETENITPKQNQENKMKDFKTSSVKSENNNDGLESIELSSDLPIDNINLDTWGQSNNCLESCNFTDDTETDFYNRIDSEEILKESNDLHSNNATEKSSKDLDLLHSIFEMAGKMISPRLNLSRETNDSSKDFESRENANEDTKEDAAKHDDFLPQTPDEIMRWSLSLETALIRRLRNLSHLVNIELIRMGIINSFIPLNLLDAAISGEVSSVNAPSNILKLRLPLSTTYDNEIEVACILIRLSELEFDHLMLRKCRQKLTQKRNNLLKMIRQHRYWQNRSLAEEVREHWWKSIPQKQITNPESS